MFKNILKTLPIRQHGRVIPERWSCKLSHKLLFYQPNWGQLEMQKGQKIDKHAESRGQVCWVLGWRHTTASLLLFSNNSSFTLLLFFSIL
jgi:hypothetical protein